MADDERIERREGKEKRRQCVSEEDGRPASINKTRR
jgi:hypothetical protein